ncbi:MAG: chorismate synthase [Gammaproteobacteria bacterium]|nr:chorismate synthase [Gammaproteobacteria bacterium]
MSGNSFGQAFRVTTFGESHGTAIGAVIDGCPPGLPVETAAIEAELARRATARSRFVSQRREPDRVEILSGVLDSVSTGTPIALLIRNADARSKDYARFRDVFRPGHADFSYQAKYGRRDWRGGGRASARETAARVAAGAIARTLLAAEGIAIRAWLAAVGELEFERGSDLEAGESNPYFCPQPERVQELEDYLQDIWKAGDSIGARVDVEATGVPAGLGEPVFDKLDAAIAQAMMSIPAVKAVAIGDGFEVVRQRGSEHRDAMGPAGFGSNHAGGTLGGISSGQPIRASVAFKPTSSIPQAVDSIDSAGNPATVKVTGRHDPCVGLRAPPIVEAMLALVLADQLLRDRAQNSKPLSRE